jgi:hypothetical protein
MRGKAIGLATLVLVGVSMSALIWLLLIQPRLFGFAGAGSAQVTSTPAATSTAG